MRFDGLFAWCWACGIESGACCAGFELILGAMQPFCGSRAAVGCGGRGVVFSVAGCLVIDSFTFGRLSLCTELGNGI